MAPIVFILALLMPAALGSTTGCLNATLPNILDLESCIGTSLELCDATLEDVLAAVVQVVGCLLEALLETDILGGLDALLDIIEIILGTLGLSLGPLTNLIKPLCCEVNVPGCKTILSRDHTCLEPIMVTLPGELNLGQCFNETLLLCKNGDLATDQLLVNLVNALVCLINALIASNPTGLITGLACAVADALGGAAATASLTLKAPLLALSASIELAASCA